jgi:hypothetical protein
VTVLPPMTPRPIPSLERLQHMADERNHCFPWFFLDGFQVVIADDHFRIRWPGIRATYRVAKS